MSMKNIICISLVLALLVPAAPLWAAGNYKNALSQKQWSQYGVNPWRLDTDNDGYPDDWEIKNGYCPTNQNSVLLGDTACEKGSFNLKKQTYTPPDAFVQQESQPLVPYASCAKIKSDILEHDVYWPLGPYQTTTLAQSYLPYAVEPLMQTTGLVTSTYTDGTVSLVIQNKINENNERAPVSTVVELWQKTKNSRQLMRSFEYEGELADARIDNGYAYIAVVRDGANLPDTKPASTFVPLYRTQSGSKKINSAAFVPVTTCSAVLHPAMSRDVSMVTFVALPLHTTEKPGMLVVVGAGAHVSLAHGAGYVFMSNYHTWWAVAKPELTEAYVVDLYKNRITYRTSQTIGGTVYDTHSIDRTRTGEPITYIATTKHNADAGVQNNIYIFDADFNKVGWLENVGGSDDVAALWSVDTTLYMTTYNMLDPLFMFSVLDPRAPVSLGAMRR